MQTAAAFLLLIATACIGAGTVHRTVSLAWLLGGAVVLTGWAAATLWPHPAATVRQEDLEALNAVVGECPACTHGDGPCRCTTDCGQRICTGWYAEHERQMCQ